MFRLLRRMFCVHSPSAVELKKQIEYGKGLAEGYEKGIKEARDCPELVAFIEALKKGDRL